MIRRNTVLAKIVEINEYLNNQPVTVHEQNEAKKAILDRIGCGLAAKRLGLGKMFTEYINKSGCIGNSTVWGTKIRAAPHISALVNGASSSHLEYDSHDSMVPAVLALGEQYRKNGCARLTSCALLEPFIS
jgi:2-methylcitrate dehydratase PrpD